MTKKKNIFSRLWAWIKKMALWKKILLLGCLIGLLWWLKGMFFGAPSGPSYKTAHVKKGDIVDFVEASGPINPVNTTEIGALVSGEILKIYVDYNTEVKKGDLMAVIDQTQILADLEEAKASLSSAKENFSSAEVSYRLAKNNLERYQSLYEKGYVSKVNLEEYELNFVNARSSLNSAKASVVRSQASLDRAEKDLSNTKIVSPIDGMVLTKKISEGQTITSGFSTPELFVVAQDLTKMQIEAKVSEADIVKIKAGQQADFTLDGYMGETFKGTVRQVRTNYVDTSSSSGTSSGTTYTVIVDVDNQDLRLKPGMTATLTIRTTDKKDVLLVPNEALRFSPSFNTQKYENTGIWKLEKGKKEPQRVDVTIGIIATKNTEITGGDIKEGDEILIDENNIEIRAISGTQRGPRGGRR